MLTVARTDEKENSVDRVEKVAPNRTSNVLVVAVLAVKA